MRNPGDLKRWRAERKAGGLPQPPAGGYRAFSDQWYQQVDLGGADDAVWWLGHAALLLRINGYFLLVDPALSAAASPVTFLGPRRRTPVPLAISSLPSLRYVLISHNHHDHLDRRTIKLILKHFPETEFIVPLGLESWFRRVGARNVTQLDWWQCAVRGALSFHAVPGRHWSMRTPWDRNRTLWCGWVVRYQELNFWFSGDSGYSDNLLAIPERLGPFNLAALPIDAYKPAWFMHGVHMNPFQAVKLHLAAGCPVTIPIHWGVFELTDESLDEPPATLYEAMGNSGLDSSRFRPWKIGERFLLNGS